MVQDKLHTDPRIFYIEPDDPISVTVLFEVIGVVPCFTTEVVNEEVVEFLVQDPRGL